MGDSPPEGSSVKSPDAVPGKDISFFTLTHTLTASHGELLTLNSPKASQASRETVTQVSSQGIYVCIFKVTRVQLLPYVSSQSHRFGPFMIIGLKNILLSKSQRLHLYVTTGLNQSVIWSNSH